MNFSTGGTLDVVRLIDDSSVQQDTPSLPISLPPILLPPLSTLLAPSHHLISSHETSSSNSLSNFPANNNYANTNRINSPHITGIFNELRAGNSIIKFYPSDVQTRNLTIADEIEVLPSQAPMQSQQIFPDLEQLKQKLSARRYIQDLLNEATHLGTRNFQAKFLEVFKSVFSNEQSSGINIALKILGPGGLIGVIGSLLPSLNNQVSLTLSNRPFALSVACLAVTGAALAVKFISLAGDDIGYFIRLDRFSSGAIKARKLWAQSKQESPKYSKRREIFECKVINYISKQKDALDEELTGIVGRLQKSVEAKTGEPSKNSLLKDEDLRRALFESPFGLDRELEEITSGAVKIDIEEFSVKEKISGMVNQVLSSVKRTSLQIIRTGIMFVVSQVTRIGIR